VTRAQLFPAALILLDAGAAIMYALDGDARRAVYWLAAAVLTIVVTW
jgi:hypothetical protein